MPYSRVIPKLEKNYAQKFIRWNNKLTISSLSSKENLLEMKNYMKKE